MCVWVRMFIIDKRFILRLFWKPEVSPWLIMRVFKPSCKRGIFFCWQSTSTRTKGFVSNSGLISGSRQHRTCPNCLVLITAHERIPPTVNAYNIFCQLKKRKTCISFLYRFAFSKIGIKPAFCLWKVSSLESCRTQVLWSGCSFLLWEKKSFPSDGNTPTLPRSQGQKRSGHQPFQEVTKHVLADFFSSLHSAVVLHGNFALERDRAFSSCFSQLL